MKHWLGLVVALALVAAHLPGGAVDVFQFSSEAQEARYQRLIDELRCVVCQGQAISESNADLAKDLRRKVYEQIQAGKSDEEIMAYMVARYSDFVLYRPPFKATTALLWVGPFIILAIGVGVAFVFVRRRRASRITADSQADERARALLEEIDRSS
jgi:cytochrome c-type biogenesis protein CcmH